MQTDGKAGPGTLNERAADLLQDVARGDRPAMNRLYGLLEAPVYRFALARLNDPAAAGDVLNETMIQLWREAGRFRGDSKVLTWALGIAFRRTMDRLRTADSAAVGEAEPAPPRGVAGDMTVVLERMDDPRRVRDAVRRLSATQRAALHLAFHEDLSYAEMAQVLGCQEGQVEAKVVRAKQALKRELSA
jgi:RNA polymerase sigma-70 factor (ECF subfamily)